MQNQQLKVLNRHVGYQTVSLAELQALLADKAKIPDVHHVNAVGELADPTFFPLLDRALRSSDHLLHKAVSRMAVRLKSFALAPTLRELATKCEHPLTKSLLLASSIYLSHPDRG